MGRRTWGWKRWRRRMRRQQEDGFQILTSSRGRHIRYPCSDVPVFEQMRTGFHVAFFLVPRDGKIEKIPSSCSTNAAQKELEILAWKLELRYMWAYFNLWKNNFLFLYCSKLLLIWSMTFLFHRFILFKFASLNFKKLHVNNLVTFKNCII